MFIERVAADLARKGKDLPSTANLESAVSEAIETYNKSGQMSRIFVDFTGVTCKNCKDNENNVFPKPEINSLLKNFLIVKLYTDSVPKEYYDAKEKVTVDRQNADADVNLQFQRKVFNTETLPTYVILQPDLNGSIIDLGEYKEGRINDVNAFAQFLRDPSSAAK